MDEAGSGRDHQQQQVREELHGASAAEWRPVTQGCSSADAPSAGEAANGTDVPEPAMSPPVAAEPSAASSSSTIGMFFAMDSVVAGDDAINIIEDGDHVTAEDFGLGGTDISASADMTHMGMNMELNALQIQAFLARADSDAGNNVAPVSSSAPGQAASISALPTAAQGQKTADVVAAANASADSQSSQQQHKETECTDDGQANSSSAEKQATEATTAVTNAYDASRDVVFYSRREDKMKRIREHPIVDAVSADGRQVTCKCGRVVRLNPPWYILKFEQHIVSRNCTFLRKKPKSATSSSNTASAARRARVETPQASPGDAVESVASVAVGVDNNGNENGPGAPSSSEAASGQSEAPASGTESEAPRREALDSTPVEAIQSTQAPLSLPVATSSGGDPDAMSTLAGETNESESGYALCPLREVLAAAFGVASDGSTLPPTASLTPSPATSQMIQSERTETAAEHAHQRQQQYDAAMVLQSHPHFSRITPDGLIVECKCSKLIVLSGPWAISKFLEHVAEKSKMLSSKKKTAATSNNNNSRRSTTLSSYAPLQRQNLSTSNKRSARSFASLAAVHSGAALRLKKKSFPSEIHWDVAQARNILPCPGLRDEKMNLFVESAVHLTGGARPRHKIAQELFPQLYPEPLQAATPVEGSGSGDGNRNGRGERLKIASQLSREEKLLLHDAIEAEALWFIDKDGNSVRSLDCRGMIDTARGESVCASCVELRSNVSLRTAATFMAKKAKTQRNPLNRKFCSSRVFSALEAEFNMDEEYARVLRDLSLADIADDSVLNMWFDMAEMGINGDFDGHSALLGLVESMAALKDKERRGVGMQNMFYSGQLDAFMRSIADISPDACDFFQHHLCGRKQKVLQLNAGGRKRKSQSSSMEPLPPPASLEQQLHSTSSYAVVSDSGNEGDRSAEEMHIDDEQQHQHHHHHHHLLYDASSSLGQAEGFASLLDASNGSLMPSLSINDIQDVDLSSFTTSSHVELERSDQQLLETSSSHQHQQDDQLAQEEPSRASLSTTAENQHMTNGQPEDDDVVEEQAGEDPSSSTTEPSRAPQPLENMPCTGLRDEKVLTFVKIAVQIIGGSRPKYVIAKELFPHVFSHEKTVKIVEKLDETQKQMLQDAVFSECLWRVDKVGSCVRSLRCQRFTDKKTSKSGVCRACRDLKSVPNFRSMLSRAKTPKNLENVKYMPSTYTESDPFLRKLSKNASFRALYQLVKLKADDDKKKAAFWLKFARMGVFGNFRTHPVFEGLMESMVEVKDKERRGVGKQNMQYSKPLDDFMNAFSAISMEAFDLFASQFCGRTIRSQKVKKRKAMPSSASLSVYSSQSHNFHSVAVSSDLSGAMTGLHQQHNSELHNNIIDMHQQQQLGSHHHLQSHHHHHHLMAADELLGGRSMTASDLEESQRFMDRMLDEVRELSSHDIQQLHGDAGDSGAALEPRTYLDEEGVLTTEI